MPELAEVEYFRKQWNPGIGRKVLSVELHADKRIFRGTNASTLESALTGARLLGSEARGKQMIFRFSGGGWLGIHLGMTGKLTTEAADHRAKSHEHLMLRQKDQVLVFRDSRMFGRVRFDQRRAAPPWWQAIGTNPSDLTLADVRQRMGDRKVALKAALLDQKRFPGIGNWMADEICWQARVHPGTHCASLSDPQIRSLHRCVRSVSRVALRTIGKDWSDPPGDWLIHVRWRKRGDCPRHGTPLEHSTIGGRTTAWCPLCRKGRATSSA